MKVFCINGISLSGKDTFVKCVQELLGFDKVGNISTIDPVKVEYKNFFGWEGEKTPIHRKNLNTLKNIWRETSNGPINWSRYQMNIEYIINQRDVLFIMVREFDEMLDLVKLAVSIGYVAFTLQVVRDGLDIPPVEQEFLDSHPKDFKYDITISNPTVDTFPDVPKLKQSAYDFIQTFLNMRN